MTNFSTQKERILQFIEYKGISKNKFYIESGISNGVLDKKSGLSMDTVEKFYSTFPEINPEWLLTGKGEMLKVKSKLPLDVHFFEGEIPKGAKPFFNLPVSAGNSLFEVMGVNQPDGFIYNLPGMAFTENFLPVVGYSMEPEVKENSIIGVRKMDRWETLNTTKKYLIITHEDRMIKYIEHDEANDDILWCVSPNYKRFKVYKSDIVEIQRITFVINPE